MKTIILKNPRLIVINALWRRNSGLFKFIEANIVIKTNSLEKAPSIRRKIEGEIRKQVSHVDHVLIHYETEKQEASKLAIPLKEDKQSLSEHFGEAPYFYLVTMREQEGLLLSEAFHGNSFAGEKKGKGLKSANGCLKGEQIPSFFPKDLRVKEPITFFQTPVWK